MRGCEIKNRESGISAHTRSEAEYPQRHITSGTFGAPLNTEWQGCKLRKSVVLHFVLQLRGDTLQTYDFVLQFSRLARVPSEVT